MQQQQQAAEGQCRRFTQAAATSRQQIRRQDCICNGLNHKKTCSTVSASLCLQDFTDGQRLQVCEHNVMLLFKVLAPVSTFRCA